MINLESEIAQALKEFSAEVTEGLDKSKEENAKNAVKELKTTSPVGRRGRYAKGWKAKRVGTTWVIFNSTDYQLTHLLEKGHALVGGGRTKERVHIYPAEQNAIIGYEKQLEKLILGR